MKGDDSCNGDSGGPLVCRMGSQGYTLVGITSWGINPCGSSTPGVYTNIHSYIDWIDENINCEKSPLCKQVLK